MGVVIEEDSKIEEAFLAELAEMHEELMTLNAEAQVLEGIISKNIQTLAEA